MIAAKALLRPGLGAALLAGLVRRQARLTQLRQAQARERSSRLYGFIQEAWPVIEPSTPFVGGWALQAICEHLEAVTEGRIQRLLITIPPGMMKSLAVSVFWPAWEWGPKGLPHLRYLSTSYSDANVTRDGLRMRRLVESDWYQGLWGDQVSLSRDQNSKFKFENTKTGYREGRAFASMTGARADRVLIDDPHSVDTAESDTARASAVRTFREAVTDRVNDAQRSAIVLIMQRLHERDIAGVILSAGMPYVHLNLPMEFEADRRCVTAIGFADPRQREGELLFPERFSQAAVEALKKDKGQYAYAAQYQQRPAPRSGGLFKREWFEIVETSPTEGPCVRAWDLAATAPTHGRDPDYTAGVRVRRAHTGAIYIEAVARIRGSSMAVENLITNTAALDGAAVRIRLPQDPGQAGKAQADHLIRQLLGYTVSARPVTGDKATRASPAAAQAEAGNIKLVKGAWNEAFLDELCVFPVGAHDDQVDALADAINELASGSTYNIEAFG